MKSRLGTLLLVPEPLVEDFQSSHKALVFVVKCNCTAKAKLYPVWSGTEEDKHFKTEIPQPGGTEQCRAPVGPLCPWQITQG